MASCIIVSRDGPIRVVPRSLAARWTMVNDCLTDMKCEVVEVPLSGAETETWIDLDTRMESRFTLRGEGKPSMDLNSNGRRVPPLLPPATVLHIVNYMNPVSEAWRLHYIPSKVVNPTETLSYPAGAEDCYHKLGMLLLGEKIHYSGWYDTLFENLADPKRTDDASKRMTLRAILYCDWMRNDAMAVSWMDVDWCPISTLSLHHTFYTSLGQARENEGPHSDSLLIALGGPCESQFTYLLEDKWLNLIMGGDEEAHLLFWERIFTYMTKSLLNLAVDLQHDWLDASGMVKVASLDFPKDKTEPTNKLAKLTVRIARGEVGGTHLHRDLLRKMLHVYHQAVQLGIGLLNCKKSSKS